jgi:hypothetical protein
MAEKKEKKEVNEFDSIETDSEFGSNETDTPPSNFKNGDVEVTPDDMMPSMFVKNPEVGQSLLLEVEKVVRSDKTVGKNKATGEQFSIGLKKKDGTVSRTDLITKQGRYTLSTWEIFFKLFGPEGLLNRYAKMHNNSFNGAQIRITKNFSGQYAQMKTEMIAKLLEKTIAEAEAYRKEVAEAMKERRLYTVELLN